MRISVIFLRITGDRDLEFLQHQDDGTPARGVGDFIIELVGCDHRLRAGCSNNIGESPCFCCRISDRRIIAVMPRKNASLCRRTVSLQLKIRLRYAVYRLRRGDRLAVGHISENIIDGYALGIIVRITRIKRGSIRDIARQRIPGVGCGVG